MKYKLNTFNMKKILLSICLFAAASIGQTYAAGTIATASQQTSTNDDLMGNKRFTVQVSTGESGQIEIQGTGTTSKNSTASATINTGENVVLVITPEDGYQLKALFVDGVDVTANVASDGTYTITSLSKNMSISATFEKKAVKGDVDLDGQVNSTDVVAAYNYIINGTESGILEINADVDESGEVNSTDIVAIYNIIIGGE